MERYFPSQCIYKADQWVLLSRKHVVEIIRLCQYVHNRINNTDTDCLVSELSNGRVDTTYYNTYVRLYDKVMASDEMIIPTTLALLGFINDTTPIKMTDIAVSINNNNENEDDCRDLDINRCRATYSDWSEKMPNPKTFRIMRRSDFITARGEGCLFFRKLISDKQYIWSDDKSFPFTSVDLSLADNGNSERISVKRSVDASEVSPNELGDTLNVVSRLKRNIFLTDSSRKKSKLSASE